MGNNETQSAVLALSSARNEALAQSYAGYNAGGGGGGTVNVTVNAGSVVGSSSDLVETVRLGILAGQGSGNKILLNPLDL